ncbi:hypothetical protein BC567DRAFT_98822 [Phyllosticta citribraziliensis]
MEFSMTQCPATSTYLIHQMYRLPSLSDTYELVARRAERCAECRECIVMAKPIIDLTEREKGNLTPCPPSLPLAVPFHIFPSSVLTDFYITEHSAGISTVPLTLQRSIAHSSQAKQAFRNLLSNSFWLCSMVWWRPYRGCHVCLSILSHPIRSSTHAHTCH